MKSNAQRPRAFTLLELLVVVALIAMLSLLALGALRPTRGASLQSGQSAIANLLVVARTKSMAGNQAVRLLVNFNPSGPESSARFLRHVVLQVETGAQWQTLTDVFLPEGVYVVPGNVVIPVGLFPSGAASWTRADGSPMRSTALRANNSVTAAVNGPNVELWLCLPLSALGTTTASGDLVLAGGRPRAPGAFGAGESPIELVNADDVRGLALSQYGVATMIEGRASF
jgi:prepilin-type N-terminal cleavage/methylation domain-containing protein